MGPTTAALLRYYQADQAYLEARRKLEAATRDVRVQETRVQQLQAEHEAAHRRSIELEGKGRELESDLKSREDRIELLRTRQTNAANQKEYQALIVEINTQKVDKGKLEEQALAQMEQVETSKKVEADLKARRESEGAKLVSMKAEIDTKVKTLTAELESLRGPRDEMGKSLPHGALSLYQRASERYDGEAMASIEKPDPRDIEYLCTGCNTYLVANIYNRLMSSKDEIVPCPGCSRILFVPAEMTPEFALSKKAERGTKPAGAAGDKPKRAPRAKKTKETTGPVEPGSIAAAIAAGAASAAGKGPKSTYRPPSAPPETRADGSMITSDSPGEAAQAELDTPVVDEAGDTQAQSASPTSSASPAGE